MRTLLLLLVSLLCLSGQILAPIVGGGGVSDTTPAGATLTESFGDSSTLCWAGGTSACNQTWAALSGSGYSLVATPGTPPVSASVKSLHMVTPTYIVTAGSFPRIPAGTTLDLDLTIYVESHSVAAWGLADFLKLSADGTGGANAVVLSFYNNTLALQLQAVGATSSSAVNISLSAWHDVHLHLESGAGASYLAVDGGAHQTFTVASQDIIYTLIGSGSTLTFDVGNLKIDSLSSAGRSLYADFESGSNGNAVTVANLTAGTHGGNGTWTISTSPMTGMVVSTDSEQTLHSAAAASGVTYTDAGSTRGVRYDVSGANKSATYGFKSYSPSVSAGFFFKMSIANDMNYYSLFDIGSATDFATAEINNGKMYLESNNCDGLGGTLSSVSYFYAADTWYWIALQYNAGGTHRMRVYETTGWTQVAAMSCQASSSDLPGAIKFGRTGAEPGTPAGYWYFDDIVVDYHKGSWITP